MTPLPPPAAGDVAARVAEWRAIRADAMGHALTTGERADLFIALGSACDLAEQLAAALAQAKEAADATDA